MTKIPGLKIINILWPFSIGLLVTYYLLSQYLSIDLPVLFWPGISFLFLTLSLEIIFRPDSPAPRNVNQRSANAISLLLKLLLAISLLLRYLNIKYGIIFLLISFLLLFIWNMLIMIFPADKTQPNAKQDNLLDD